jgi:tetratricopeptide (TPR) repeat protein
MSKVASPGSPGIAIPGSLRPLVTLVMILSVGSHCAADPGDSASGTDRVVVQQAGKSGRVALTGSIEDYTGRGLLLQTRSGVGTTRFTRDEVLEVSTNYFPQHVVARKLFAEGRIAEAEAAFKEALDDENRTWVRREILASQVKCALWDGDYRRAAQRFLPIVESDPDTIYFGLMPLTWAEKPLTTLSLADAQRWLQSNSAAAKLLGASWLYHGSERATAVKTLQGLATSPQPTIQRLAQMQLWRVRLDAGDVTLPETRRWATLVDELDADLRAGPLFLVGRAYEQQHDWLNAAAAWLWLPLELSEHRHLAADAQLRSADALFRAGDVAAARQQSQELLLRFGDTPAATRARELLQSMTSESQ